ncbi:uncharacterized protein ig2599ANME_0521 [groundwater metagenome]
MPACGAGARGHGGCGRTFDKQIATFITAQRIQNITIKKVAEFPSLRYRTYTSATLNSLVSKGVLGKFKEGYSYYFTTLGKAVMVHLKKREEEPGRCSHAEIAKET